MTFVKPENRLYYYCKLNTALEFILPDKKLLLSPIDKTNDPRENKSFLFSSLYRQGTDLSKIELPCEEISKIIREDCKVLCFSQDHNAYFGGYESSRMWAYYGDNHKGLCLLLDKEEFLKENENTIYSEFLRKINYIESFIEIDIEPKMVDYTLIESMGKSRYLKERFRIEHLNYLFFTKNIEWESEKETRLLHFSNKNENEYCSIKNSLKNIYVGVDFHESYLPSLTKLCPNIDIDKLEYLVGRLITNQIINAANANSG